MKDLLYAAALIAESLKHSSLKKVVFSRPREGSTLRAEGKLLLLKGQPVLQYSVFKKDGKALHQNIERDNWDAFLADTVGGYGQINLMDANGTAEILVSKKGKVHISGEIDFSGTKTVAPATHDKTKNYILDSRVKYDFLVELDIQDEKGKIYDKKQAKFRQINRFLEIVADAQKELPVGDTPLCIWDLCCGKSYLTFAVYYFFTAILKRNVILYGVDLKRDMIEKCTEIAEKLGYDSMRFVCGDITAVDIPDAPDIVISLHACDTATDVVLAKAVTSSAKLILSSPCCHHELSEQLSSPFLSFITAFPRLKQKLSETITDALRCKLLMAHGYDVAAIEFIDPDETPKNLLIRAEKEKTPRSHEKEMAEYRSLLEELHVMPTMYRLLKGERQK